MKCQSRQTTCMELELQSQESIVIDSPRKGRQNARQLDTKGKIRHQVRLMQLEMRLSRV